MKSRKISLSQIVSKLRAVRPTRVGQLRAAGLKLKLLGVGAYREAFKVTNSDVVIKFPASKTTSEGIKHSAMEIKRIRKLRESSTLTPFLPEVIFYDRKAGVVAMRHYETFENFELQADALGKMIGKMMSRISGMRCTDVHTENVRRGRGKLDAVLIDLGF